MRKCKSPPKPNEAKNMKNIMHYAFVYKTNKPHSIIRYVITDMYIFPYFSQSCSQWLVVHSLGCTFLIWINIESTEFIFDTGMYSFDPNHPYWSKNFFKSCNGLNGQNGINATCDSLKKAFHDLNLPMKNKVIPLFT